MLGLYDVVFAWDHELDQGWVFSHGFSIKDPQIDREKRATLRLNQFLSWVEHDEELNESYHQPSVHAMAHGLTAEQFETRLGGGWLGNFDSEGYRAAVQKARDYIYAGDIFQVNLSQRLLCPARCKSDELYEHLRLVNAAPFAGYFDFGSGQIISASPERFYHVRDRWIETRPIKGTRRRTGNVELDRATAEELLSSEKDRSENVMIVDLLRNDLSRVCDPNSMVVEKLCNIEEYPFVLHLVSVIRARLRREVEWSDVMAAVFPGGSITGAPKVRAMEIIAELEPTVRGPYCGSLGYCGADGSMDWNILIRTLTASRGWWQFQVGGGIVADSEPASEEEETWTKAAGLVAAIERGTVSPV
jgi:para-aminobenzoate synthetase component 1